MFLKLLEAVLKTGNRMNVGTNRGDAHAFKLDTLLKLVDVKGADGKTTLLHFVVQEIIKGEGTRLSGGNQNEQCTTNDDAKCRKLGLQVVSNITSELMNVKNAAAMDSEVLHSDVLKLSKGIGNIAEVAGYIEAVGSEESSTKKFSESMNRFMEIAEEKIIRLQAQEALAMSLVKEITEYFHGDSAREGYCSKISRNGVDLFSFKRIRTLEKFSNTANKGHSLVVSLSIFNIALISGEIKIHTEYTRSELKKT